MRKRTLIVIGLIAIVALVVFSLGFVYLVDTSDLKLDDNRHIKNMCEIDTDCTIILDTSKCCSCPQAFSKNILKVRYIIEYERGKDYSDKFPFSCSDFQCASCRPIDEVECYNNRCIVKESTHFFPN